MNTVARIIRIEHSHTKLGPYCHEIETLRTLSCDRNNVGKDICGAIEFSPPDQWGNESSCEWNLIRRTEESKNWIFGIDYTEFEIYLQWLDHRNDAVLFKSLKTTHHDFIKNINSPFSSSSCEFHAIVVKHLLSGDFEKFFQKTEGQGWNLCSYEIYEDNIRRNNPYDDVKQIIFDKTQILSSKIIL